MAKKRRKRAGSHRGGSPQGAPVKPGVRRIGLEVAPKPWRPAIDIVDTPDRVKVYVEIPGIDPGEVSFFVEGEVLTVEGERRELPEADDLRIWAERWGGPFRRQVRLSAPVQVDRTTTSYRGGLLEIVLPKVLEGKTPE